MNRTSTAISTERPRSRRRSYDQVMSVEVALFAITGMTSILALVYYVYINSP
jgi:hypothetical protein